jgi:O-antigen ligase
LAPHPSLDAVVVLLTAAAWGAVLSWTAVEARDVATALVASATVVAAWAVVQWLGIDPLEAAGWRVIAPGSPRMRVYASLGNPNFVGAFLAATLPVSMTLARLRPSRGPIVAAALQLAGIAATGSRGAWLGTLVGVSVVMVQRGCRKGRLTAAAVSVVMLVGLGIWLGPARPLGETLRGRIYIWSVTAPHLLDHPISGLGPGGFALRYPEWQAERLTRGVDDDVRRYLTPTRHAHNDYLEALVERGIPGLVSWLALVAAVIGHGWSQRHGIDAVARGAAGGAAALAAIALVDFPFARCVEMMTWWTLATLAAAPGPREGDRVESLEPVAV